MDKSFLEKIGYISLENFKMLLKEFSFRAESSKFNRTAFDFLKKSPIKKFYASELAFLSESSEEREKLEVQHSWNEIFGDEKVELEEVQEKEEKTIADKIEDIIPNDGNNKSFFDKKK